MTDIERLKAAHLEAIDKGGEEYGLQYQQTIMEAATACTAVSLEFAKLSVIDELKSLLELTEEDLKEVIASRIRDYEFEMNKSNNN